MVKMRGGKSRYGANRLSTMEVEENEALFRLKFTTLSAGKLSDHLSLSEIQKDLSMNQSNQLSRIDLSYMEETSAGSSVELADQIKVSVAPNPFSDRCVIELELQVSQDVVLELWDTSGKILFRQAESRPAGTSLFYVEADKLSGNGLYLYKITSETSTYTGKIAKQ